MSWTRASRYRTPCRKAPLPSPALEHGRFGAGTQTFQRPATQAGCSHRQIIVLLRRHLDLLPPQHGERAGKAPSRLARHDDVVDIAALGGGEGGEEPLLIVPG